MLEIKDGSLEVIYHLVLTLEVHWLLKMNRNLPLGVFLEPMVVRRPMCGVHGLILLALGV